VKLFVCGPTVYDYVHLGHARTYIAFDIIARYLTFCGYDVNYLMNLTDVADRIVERAKELRKTPPELAREYEKAFFEDMEGLGINSVKRYERASDYIPQIIDQIRQLMAKGVAYETSTGVYFEVQKYPKFGQLSGLSWQELSLRRLELCSSKKNPEDFSLWRKYERSFGWDSPWGFGRPGWHVEDTAISMNNFGDTYDLHGGASELMFPHHEAEIAQAEALSGKTPFVRFWLHTGLLTMGGRKMSKSLGNVIRIRDGLKEYTAHELRYYFASFHYREPVRISDGGLRRARSALQFCTKNFMTFMEGSPQQNSTNNRKLGSVMHQAEKSFRRHMDNDFDTPNAVKILVSLSKQLKRFSRSGFRVDQDSKGRAAEVFRRMWEVFGIFPG
jgi:cysteinyl-tRNA synthetase